MIRVLLFGSAGLLLWALTPRRAPKRKPGPWLDPSRERTLDLRNYRGQA